MKYFFKAVLLLLMFRLLVPVLFAQQQPSPGNNKAVESQESDFLKEIKESAYFLNSLNKNNITELRKNQLGFSFYPFIIFISSIIFIVLSKIANPDFYKQLLLQISGPSLRTEPYSNRQWTVGFLNILLDICKLAVISLLFYIFLSEYVKINYLMIVLVILGFTIGKIMLIYPFYMIFFGSQKKNLQLDIIFGFNRALLLFILPLTIGGVYAPHPINIWLTGTGVLLVVIFAVWKNIKLFFQIKYNYNYSFLYIFLYICIFEISLYFILIKEFYSKI